MGGPLKIAVCGGGTGGHVIPALNICKALERAASNRSLDIGFLYIGAAGSLEQRLAQEAGLKFRSVWISALRRGTISKNIILPLKCTVSLIQAGMTLAVFKPDMVIGTGGFSAWPTLQVARIAGIPYVLQEQNAYPGLVTRLMAKAAVKIFLGYGEAAKHLDADSEKLLHTGNPVSLDRPAGKAGTAEPTRCLPGVDATTARRKLGLDPERATVLVTGGSGGALSINRVVNAAKDEILARGNNLIWQCGAHWDGSVEIPNDARGKLLIERFLPAGRMALAYRAADVALCRSGAMTLAELAAHGLPAILVPFPFAAEGHQHANARAVAAVGAARLIPESELTPERLIGEIGGLLEPVRKREMSSAMKGLAIPDAANRIAEDIIQIMIEAHADQRA